VFLFFSYGNYSEFILLHTFTLTSSSKTLITTRREYLHSAYETFEHHKMPRTKLAARGPVVLSFLSFNSLITTTSLPSHCSYSNSSRISANALKPLAGSSSFSCDYRPPKYHGYTHRKAYPLSGISTTYLPIIPIPMKQTENLHMVNSGSKIHYDLYPQGKKTVIGNYPDTRRCLMR